MSRPLRYLPEGGSLVEVTCRTLHARFLLRPCPQWNQIAIGVLGRAQRLYGVQIHLVSLLSNHFHILATFREEPPRGVRPPPLRRGGNDHALAAPLLEGPIRDGSPAADRPDG